MEPDRGILSLTPWTLFQAALQAFPPLKYALGVLGVVSAIAIIKGLGIDIRIAIFGTIVMVVLMTVLVIFAALTKVGIRQVRHAAFVLMWSSLGLTVLSASLLFTSAFFDYPKPPTQLFSSGLPLPSVRGIKAKVTGIQRQQLITAFSSEVTSAGPDIGAHDEVAFVSSDALSANWVFKDDSFGGSAFFVDLDVNEDSLELVGVDVKTIRFCAKLPHVAANDGVKPEGPTPSLILLVEVASPTGGVGYVLVANARTGTYAPFERVPLREGFVRLMIQLARQGTGRGEFELRLRIRRTTDGHEETLPLSETLKAAFLNTGDM